ELTWALEHVEPPVTAPRFRQIADLSELPRLVDSIVKAG
ncbi:MAG: HAD family hydrolase, partial [Mesorhizobium sp.]